VCMPIYTKTGDKGTSQIGNAGRVRKDDTRLEALGTLDELNSALGVANYALKKPDAVIEQMQSDLLFAGAALSGTINGDDAVEKFERKTAEMEKIIDEIEAGLPPLKNFILPGGCKSAAALHWARTVARRAERRIVSGNFGVIGDRMLPFFNRMSSYLFVRARKENADGKIEERIWKKE
jgi:cob(I)alamin adenosyltransferase